MIGNAGNPPTQIRPQGLMGFLELKRGQAPAVLPDVLQGVLDLSPWYLESNGESFNTGNFSAALGSFGIATLTVPQGEWWYVHGFSVQSETLGAGEALQHCLVVARGDGGGITMISQPGNLAGVGNLAIASLARPLFVPPGSSLAGFGLVFTGPISCTAGIAFTRLPI